MTKKEALNILYNASVYHPDYLDALNMAINALEQESTTKNDLALIYTEGLDEEIRCTMCTNYMKSDRGCDGSCVVDKDMYKAVMDAIEKRIQPSRDYISPIKVNADLLSDFRRKVLEDGNSRV